MTPLTRHLIFTLSGSAGRHKTRR